MGASNNTIRTKFALREEEKTLKTRALSSSLMYYSSGKPASAVHQSLDMPYFFLLFSFLSLLSESFGSRLTINITAPITVSTGPLASRQPLCIGTGVNLCPCQNSVSVRVRATACRMHRSTHPQPPTEEEHRMPPTRRTNNQTQHSTDASAQH